MAEALLKESHFSTDILMDWERVLSLEPEWNQLLRQSRADIFFLTWEWVQAWYSVAGQNMKPFVVVVRDAAGSLAGLAPFYFSIYRLLRCVPYRVLRIMADHETGAEYLNWVVRADVEKEVYRSIVSALDRTTTRWDCIWMPYVPKWTGAADRIISACVNQRFFVNLRPVEFGFIDLPNNAESFLQKLSKNRRSEIRRQRNAIFKCGKVEIRSCSAPDELEQFIEALFDLHYRRWMALGEEGTFRRKPREAAFYQEFLPRAMKCGWLRMYGLFFEGAAKAVQLGYVYNGAFYQIQEGFDPEFKPGVGNVLRLHAIEDCIAGGLKVYDFLGEMSEHKRRWSATARSGSDIFIGKKGIKNSVVFKNGIWPTGSYLMASTPPA